MLGQPIKSFNERSTTIENKVAIVITILFITQNFPLERIINQSIKATKSRKLAAKPIIPSAILAPIFSEVYLHLLLRLLN